MHVRSGGRQALRRLASAAVFAVALALPATLAAPAPAHAAQRSLVDVELVGSTHERRVQLMDEYVQLRVSILRVGLDWPSAEPAQGVYDESYLAAFDDIATLAKERGIKLMITVASTPEWASDRSLWGSPPFPDWYKPGVYQPFYAPGGAHVVDFGALAQTLASRLSGRVFAWECWNEPNLWTWFYPQKTGGDAAFAATRYAQLLDAFSAGIRHGDPAALVVGGATAPVGSNDRLRTAPQRFAGLLKARGAGADMDAYSHHPYVPGGAADQAPEAQPLHPSTTVELSNLGALLRLFPDKPFYLTEFGYNTAISSMFGQRPVTQATQADYLQRAYRVAGRYAQVRCLSWYLLRDMSPSGRSDDAAGVYTGLRTVGGAAKRAWFTFAGGNKLTITAPASVRRGGTAVLSGALTSSRLATATSPGGLAGKVLQVQRRSGGVWRTLGRTVTTGSGGAYRLGVKTTSLCSYRVFWGGVVRSAVRRVAVR